MTDDAAGASDARLQQAQYDARREAAFATLVAVGFNLLLAAVSAWQQWRLFRAGDWWIWLVLALPAAALTVVFLLGVGRLGVSSEHRRKVVVALLAVLAGANLTATGIVIMSLLGGHNDLRGDQLLASAGVVLVVNVVTFGLVFWELDSGGPVRRALAAHREAPDFQFPQDENPQLAPAGWSPRLHDYLYIAVTNSIAFSPTDAMPLSRNAKLVMAVESVISATTVLVVAARAVNILGA